MTYNVTNTFDIKVGDFSIVLKFGFSALRTFYAYLTQNQNKKIKNITYETNKKSQSKRCTSFAGD